jgi:hypothetical protein
VYVVCGSLHCADRINEVLVDVWRTSTSDRDGVPRGAIILATGYGLFVWKASVRTKPVLDRSGTSAGKDWKRETRKEHSIQRSVAPICKAV